MGLPSDGAGTSGIHNGKESPPSIMRKPSKRTISTIALLAVFLVGLSLLLYPTVSGWWNSMHQSQAIASYSGAVAEMREEQRKELLDQARAYNETLVGKADRFTLSDEELEEYNSLLNVDGTNVIGYVDIDKIDCHLPIYHGTDDAVLQVGVGHLEGSSLPVGGESTHAVISGHRGLPSARLFTDLDQMEVGDTFTISVLDETLTYEVDQIRIVEPTDLSDLAIEEGQDLCTLVTCTPYGINTHRLLVRGHRVENASTVRVPADAMQVDPTLVAPLVAIPLLVLLAVGVLWRTRRRPGTGSAVRTIGAAGLPTRGPDAPRKGAAPPGRGARAVGRARNEGKHARR